MTKQFALCAVVASLGVGMFLLPVFTVTEYRIDDKPQASNEVVAGKWYWITGKVGTSGIQTSEGYSVFYPYEVTSNCSVGTWAKRGKFNANNQYD